VGACGTGAGVLDGDAGRGVLGELLPPYLVPALVVQVDRMPLTPAGKRDDGALLGLAAERGGGGQQGESPVPPASEAERRIRQAWCEVLGRDSVGPDDDFFLLGGDSLALIQMCQKLATYGIRLPVPEAYVATTPRAQAEIVGNANSPTGSFDIPRG
jgi:acyl carrier protein